MYARRRLILAVAAIAAMLALCGAALAVRPGGPLTGTWKGTYGGAFHGTFVLHWTETRSTLKGTIKLTGAGAGASSVKGTVSGGSIKFGTVGAGTAITYSGKVKGAKMSGSYKTPGGGGSWSARKSS